MRWAFSALTMAEHFPRCDNQVSCSSFDNIFALRQAGSEVSALFGFFRIAVAVGYQAHLWHRTVGELKSASPSNLAAHITSIQAVYVPAQTI